MDISACVLDFEAMGTDARHVLTPDTQPDRPRLPIVELREADADPSDRVGREPGTDQRIPQPNLRDDRPHRVFPMPPKPGMRSLGWDSEVVMAALTIMALPFMIQAEERSPSAPRSGDAESEALRGWMR